MMEKQILDKPEEGFGHCSKPVKLGESGGNVPFVNHLLYADFNERYRYIPGDGKWK